MYTVHTSETYDYYEYVIHAMTQRTSYHIMIGRLTLVCYKKKKRLMLASRRSLYVTVAEIYGGDKPVAPPARTF